MKDRPSKSGFYMKTLKDRDYTYEPIDEPHGRIVLITEAGDEITITESHHTGHIELQLSQMNGTDWLAAVNASMNKMYVLTVEEDA